MFTSRANLTDADAPTITVASPPGGDYTRYFASQDTIINQLNDLLENFDAILTAGGINLANFTAADKRKTVLLEAIKAAVPPTAQTTRLPQLTDVTDGTTNTSGEGFVLRKRSGVWTAEALPTANIQVNDTSPDTTDDDTGGKIWFDTSTGTQFIYRGVQGTGGVNDGASAAGAHIWDVQGTHAVGDVSAGGTFITNGISSPTGYAGNGWARFTSASTPVVSVTQLNFREISNANYFVSAIDVSIAPNPNTENNALDNRENFGVIEKANGRVSIKGGHENFSAHDRSSRMMVRITRTG